MKKLLLLTCLTAAFLHAQQWQALESLPAVDFSGLTAAQKTAALKLLREHDCTCGCGMKLAECRVKDPNCAYSRGMATVIVDSLRKGMTETDSLAAAKSSRYGQGVKRDTRVLGDPVAIPIDSSPFLGPPMARITIVEFSDFQCPYCIAAVAQLKELLKAYPTAVKLVFKQFPLDTHSQAAIAASAALAAHKQGKFWPVHDALFAQRGDLAHPKILALAGSVGLDMNRFETDMESPETRKAVERDLDDGGRAGVEGTPTLFFNGRHYNGPVRFELLKDLVDQELKKP